MRKKPQPHLLKKTFKNETRYLFSSQHYYYTIFAFFCIVCKKQCGRIKSFNLRYIYKMFFKKNINTCIENLFYIKYFSRLWEDHLNKIPRINNEQAETLWRQNTFVTVTSCSTSSCFSKNNVITIQMSTLFFKHFVVKRK